MFGHLGKLMREKKNRSVAPRTALTGAGKGNAQTRPPRALARSAPSTPDRTTLGNAHHTASATRTDFVEPRGAPGGALKRGFFCNAHRHSFPLYVPVQRVCARLPRVLDNSRRQALIMRTLRRETPKHCLGRYRRGRTRDQSSTLAAHRFWVLEGKVQISAWFWR